MFRTGIRHGTRNIGSSWKYVGTKDFTSVSCGYKARVWAISKSNKIYFRQHVSAITNWMGKNSWKYVGRGKEVSSGLDQAVYMIDTHGYLYARTGVSRDESKPFGTGWTKVLNTGSMKFRSVSRGVC